jgi:fused signal recognition particle receptor
MFSKLKNTFSKISAKVKQEAVKVNVIKKIEGSKLKKLSNDLEDELLSNNIAYGVVNEILNAVKNSSARNLKVDLKNKLKEILSSNKINILEEKNPTIIMLIGVNGAGKTTTLAKLAQKIKKNKKKCVMAAGDTFRAAAIEQLEQHGKNLDVKTISHNYGSDSAAVAFDAVEHAKSKNLDYVLIDTAGRNHANEDLMRELEKVKRVVKPHYTILVVDSLTGNDAVDQAKLFGEKIGVDGVILTKTDADERGGAIISVAHESGKPILFLGSGQGYDDLEEFDADKILNQII